jgi:hypothetical protein
MKKVEGCPSGTIPDSSTHFNTSLAVRRLYAGELPVDVFAPSVWPPYPITADELITGSLRTKFGVEKKLKNTLVTAGSVDITHGLLHDGTEQGILDDPEAGIFNSLDRSGPVYLGGIIGNLHLTIDRLDDVITIFPDKDAFSTPVFDRVYEAVKEPLTQVESIKEIISGKLMTNLYEAGINATDEYIYRLHAVYVHLTQKKPDLEQLCQLMDNSMSTLSIGASSSLRFFEYWRWKVKDINEHFQLDTLPNGELRIKYLKEVRQMMSHYEEQLSRKNISKPNVVITGCPVNVAAGVDDDSPSMTMLEALIKKTTSITRLLAVG